VTQPTFDLQSHSTRSDGSLEPADVVARAAAAGVELLALTDHDTVAGVAEALDAGRRHGVRVVPAAELSSIDDDYEDLHVLGYLVDHTDSGFRDALAAFRADRAARVWRMRDALQDLGLEVVGEELDARRAAGLPVGRPHLAAAAHTHPANAARLQAEGLQTPSDLLVAYLTPGARAYRARTIPTVAEAIGVIHAAGGLAVWAHPFWDVDVADEVIGAIAKFAAMGLDGVEAFYITHTREQTILAADACDQRGLLTTGSADFHGPGHPQFNAFRAFDLAGRRPRLGPLAET
jgi:predicted metal-dependent phosphoesterase TrpH